MILRPIFLLIFFISLVSVSAPAQDQPDHPSDHPEHPAIPPERPRDQADDQFELISEAWYAVFIDGVKSGWSSQLVYSNQDQYKTSLEQHMTLSRGGINISIAVSSDFLETHVGVPVQINTSQEALGQVSKSSWTFKGNEIMMVSEAGGDPIVKTIPAPPQSWLTPQAVKRMFVEKMNDSQPLITYTRMSPELGPKPVAVVMTRLGEEELEFLGQTTTVTRWESANDVMPVASIEMYTSKGVNVGSSMNAGFGNLETKVTTKFEALSPVNEIPELMVNLFIEPSQPIPDDPSIRQLALKVKSKDGSKLEIPSVGAQRATINDDGTTTLLINLDDSLDATDKEKS